MNAPSLSRDLALRIGLAARVLPDISPARLLQILETAVGLPPTVAGLAQLTVKDLRRGASELMTAEGAVLRRALALLQGAALADETEILPALEASLADHSTGFIQVACASNTGETLDGHFGSCLRFLIYQVAPHACRLIAIYPCDDEQNAGDKTEYRINLIQGCRVLYVASIGGPAAAKVIKAGLHPIKFPQGGSARAHVEALAQVLAGTPPPWLAKALAQSRRPCIQH